LQIRKKSLRVFEKLRARSGIQYQARSTTPEIRNKFQGLGESQITSLVNKGKKTYSLSGGTFRRGGVEGRSCRKRPSARLGAGPSTPLGAGPFDSARRLAQGISIIHQAQSQTPKSKQITRSKIQAPELKKALAVSDFEFGIWELSGIWRLGFGIYFGFLVSGFWLKNPRTHLKNRPQSPSNNPLADHKVQNFEREPQGLRKRTRRMR
jgi:hypothetical protein